ncbi:MAG: glycosyltransferase [Patescibacteria group bacterium]|nr:glycosyltransferase [Patescibacteria group bacterium]
MKILLVSPIRNTPGDPHWHWLKALKQLKHRVELFPLTGRFKWLNSWRLKQVISRFQPEEIFFSAGRDAVGPISKTVFFCGVPPAWLSPTERRIGLAAKLVVVNDSGHAANWRRLGAKSVVNLPISGVDHGVFKAAKSKRTVPVSFVGSLFANRQQQLADIVRLYPELKIWGWLPPGVNLLSQLKANYQGEAWGAKVGRIYGRSLIGLNLSPVHMKDGGNIRPFEIAGAGALLLTDQFNPDWWLSGREAIVFRSARDCADKITYYLAHPDQRQKLAAKGLSKVRREHTYRHRFTKLKQYL